MRGRLVFSLLIGSCAAPSCVVYDDALLEEAEGSSTATGEPASGGSSDGATGGDVGIVPGDGDNTGGVPVVVVGSGGTSTGGAVSGDGDSSSSGGDSGGDGDSGSGGDEACSEPSGEKVDLSGVGDTSLIEDFERQWASLGSGAPYTGSWFISRDPDGSGLTMAIQDLYEMDPCATDASLHLEASGYNTWGISLDAGLMNHSSEVDASDYVGVTFVARSPGLNQVRLGFRDGDDGNGTGSIDTDPQFIGTSWQQYFFEFPATVVEDRLTIVSLIVAPSLEHDIWIDDLTFYAAP